MELEGLELELALHLYSQTRAVAEPEQVNQPSSVILKGERVDSEGHEDRRLRFENVNGTLATFVFNTEEWTE